MKILVTGGAGFIGSHGVLEGIERGYEVVNVDVLNYAADLQNLASLEDNPRYTFVKGDIRDRDFLAELFGNENFDAVIHFAAETHVDFSISNPGIFVETNVLGMQNLLELALEHKVEKFIHISTDEVYGHLELDSPAFTESSHLEPRSPYSASKASSDMLVRSYVETFGLHACITRCSNNYGPHQDPSKLLSKTILNALKDEKIPIYGKGENIRDWLYVRDHVSAIYAVFEKGKKGSVYNIGGNNEQRNIDLAQKILSMLKKSEDLIEFVTDRPGHDFRYAIDASYIKTELGWEPRQDFDQMLEETIDWYKARV